MELFCECKKFSAKLLNFPKATPGRLICYCDDCQTYLHYINRSDLLDENGGSEIIPAYPSDIEILRGKEHLRCIRLSPKGMYRFVTSCCNTPFANTDPVRPWVGIFRRMYITKNPNTLDQNLPLVRTRVMGKFAYGQLPSGTSQTFDFKSINSIMPFLLKGIILGRSKPSPFFDKKESIVPPYVLTLNERNAARAAAASLSPHHST